MKNFTFVLIAFVFASFSASAEKGSHLFILSGQSNMAGLDPNTSFTPTVEAAFGKENIIVVKSAQGGQPIRRWYKKWKPEKGDEPKATGDLYDVLMKAVNGSIKGKKLASVTFLWMQGERDAKTGLAAAYEESMKTLIANLRKDLDAPEMNFVIGRLSDHLTTEGWEAVRTAQVKVATDDKRGAWVDTDDTNDMEKGDKKWNDLHYTKDGYDLFGQRLARQAVLLIKGEKPDKKGKPE